MRRPILTSDRAVALLAALAILPAARVPGFPLEVAGAVLLVAAWRSLAGAEGGALVGAPGRVAIRMLTALAMFVLLAGLTRGLMQPLAGMLVLLALTETLALIEEQTSFLSFLVILAASAQVTGAAFVCEDPLGLLLTLTALAGLLLAALFFERRMEAERIPAGNQVRRIRIGNPRDIPNCVLGRTLGALVLGGLLLGGSLFVLLPRAWPFSTGASAAGQGNAGDGERDGAKGLDALVGPNEGSKGIRLGDIGRIKLNQTPYFAVQMGNGEPPFLRENTYDVYREGNWTTYAGPDLRPPRVLRAGADANGWVVFDRAADASRRFDVSLLILRGPIRRLFLEREPVRIQVERHGERLRPTLVLLDNEQVDAQDPFHEGDFITQQVVSPIRDEARLRRARSDATVSPRTSYLDLPQACAPLTTAAQEVVGLEQNPWARAHLLVDWLRSDAFAYTLDMPPVTSRHPVVDFVVERRRGHCEYFASALALMLRGLGHPARVARGFRGGDFMENLGTWMVRGSHYHAWTEMYFHGPGWVALDATPPDDRATDAQAMTQAAEDLERDQPGDDHWLARLLGIDPMLIQRIEDRLGRVLTAVLASLTSLPGILLVWLLAMVIVIRRYRRRQGEAWRRESGARTHRETLSPYHRALRTLGAAGLHRRRVLTPREFLGEIATWAPEVEQDMGWLTRAHERERYGARTPESEARSEASERLAHVQGSVKRRRRRR